MPFYENIKRFFQRPETRNGVSGAESVSTSTPIMPPIRTFGQTVDSNKALKITAFYAGVRLRAENAASLPKLVRHYTDDGLVVDRQHPAYKVINVRPNSYTNVFNFWSAIYTWLDGWGNAYAIIKRDPIGRPVALHQVHPSCVRITKVDGKKYYEVRMNDIELRYLDGTYSDDDMLHFMLVTLNGIIGVNPVIYNASALGKSMAIEDFASEFFEKGGNLKAVLETEGDLGDDQYEAFMRHFAQSGNYDTPILEYGIKYKQLAVDPIASKLIESEVFSIDDICRILNIPPHMLAELSRATFSNIEHQNIQFVQYSLRPTIKRVETELEAKLFSEVERDNYDVTFDLQGLLRGDTAARSAYYHNAILDGYMSRNEVRELEGLPRIEGLDEMLYPLNTGIVGKETNEEE